MFKQTKLKIKELLSPYPYDYQGNIALHEYEALYFFIPKVACSSVKLAVADLINIPSPDPENTQAFPHKRNYPYVKRNDVLKKYNSYFRFAFVRNPWDRLFSGYQNKIVGVRSGRFGGGVLPRFLNKDSKKFHLEMSFNEFVEVVSELPDQQADYHYRSQHTFLEDVDQNLLVNFIGKFETLSEDLERVRQEIHAPKLVLPHVMKTERQKIYRDYYDARSRFLVENRYKRDIEMFGYTF